MKLAFLGAISLALGISACNPAYADEAAPAAVQSATCETQQDVIDGVINSSATQGFTVKVHAIVSGPALKTITDAINSLPPPSDYEADLAVVFEAKTADGQDDGRNLVILFKSGCKTGGYMFPHAVYERLMGSPA